MKWFSSRKKELQPTTQTIAERVEGLYLCKKYFERNSKEDKYAFLFLPEYETCDAIIKIIDSQNFLPVEQIGNIEQAYNKIIHLEHYEGSAWFDFKIRLGGLLATFGYSAHWNSGTDELIISTSATSR